MTARLARLGIAIRGLTGWRRFLLAIAAGAVSALGFAPVEFFPALLLGFAALVLLLDGAKQSPHPVRKAAVSGWAIKALLITRAAFTRGASVPHAPVRGRGLPMALGGRS